jgi:hypothetical protein
MAELTYRAAVARGIAQEMDRDPNVVLIGEDVAAAGGVFKTTEGLFERFGPDRVRDTPISEEAIIGAIMGASMNGLRPIGELMFSDFLATCWDIVANQIAKTRYMTGGQVALPLVIRTANGGGNRFGGQHAQSVENWAMAVPGLKVVAPSTPSDVIGLLAAAVRDPDPVIFFEHKKLLATKQDVPEGEIVGGGDRSQDPGSARHQSASRLHLSHRPTGDGRRESAAMRVGCRDHLHRRRGSLLGSGCADRAGDHPTHPAPGRSRVGGPGDPLVGAGRRGSSPYDVKAGSVKGPGQSRRVER